MTTYSYAQSLTKLKDRLKSSPLPLWTPPEPRYSTITGPSIFAYVVIKLPYGGEKKMILMGEYHDKFIECTTVPNCITSRDYIKKFIGKECLDIFMEDKLTSRQWFDPGSKSDSKSSVLWTIDKITDLTKSLLLHKNVRIQNWDLRRSLFSLDNFMNNKQFLEKFFKLDFHRQKLFFMYLVGYEDVVLKQFTDIVDLINRENIIREAMIVRKKITKEYEKFTKTAMLYIPKDKYPVRDNILNYLIVQIKEGKVGNISSVITDYYLVLRMFRSFGMKKKGSCIGNPYSSRIIMYAGRYHIDTILKIVSYYYPGCVKYEKDNMRHSPYLHFEGEKINKGGYRSFSDFFSWPK